METALTLCFVVVPVVFATISYGYMLSFRQTISQSAAEGARAAAVAPATADRTTAATHAVDVSMATGSALHCGAGYLTCTVSVVPSCGDGSAHDCIRVTVSYPYRAHTLLPTVPGLGFTLPSSIAYSAMAEIN